LFRRSFLLVPFLVFLVFLVVQLSVFTAPALAAPRPPAQPTVFATGHLDQAVVRDAGTSYLNKLFGDFGPAKSASDDQTGSGLPAPLEWLLIIFGTVLYGQVALLAILWILFTSDLLGILVGLLLIGICLAFIIPRKPRVIALFVLACLNFILGTGLTLVVAFQEGVPTILISLIPLGALVWLTLRQINFHFNPALKS
jgi:hypothetical protein